MEKKKLLILSDSPLIPTGYATISKNIANRMTELGWEVHFMGHNYIGQKLLPPITFEDGEQLNFRLSGMANEQYCKDIIVPKIREFQPDIFLVLLDTFMVYPWFCEMDFAPAKTIFYFPSDGGGGMPLGCENILTKVTVPVAMAKFGQKQVKECYNIDTKYIPHAANEKIYYPLSDNEKQLLKSKWGLQDKFVVGVVARNQGRKMLDRTIKAFKIFAKDKPNAILLMHTDPIDRAAAVDLRNLIIREGIPNKVIFTGMTMLTPFTNDQMREVYNLMDVFLLTTSGEGFGIPIIEAMACEIPVVATDYTTTPELVIENNAGLGAKVAAELTGSWNVERAVMDDNDCVEKLTYLYNNREEAKQMGKNGREAVLKYYTWNIVMKQWSDLFEEMTDE